MMVVLFAVGGVIGQLFSTRTCGGRRRRRGVRSVEIQQGADVRFLSSGDRIALVDEGEEDGFAVLESRRFRQGAEGDWWGAEGDAMDALEETAEMREVRVHVVALR